MRGGQTQSQPNGTAPEGSTRFNWPNPFVNAWMNGLANHNPGFGMMADRFGQAMNQSAQNPIHQALSSQPQIGQALRRTGLPMWPGNGQPGA